MTGASTSGAQRTRSFTLEWGGSEDLSIEEIWPDGDAPENPTVDDVIAALRKDADHESQFRWLADRWNLEMQDIEVTGPGGHRSLAMVLRDERLAARAVQEGGSYGR